MIEWILIIWFHIGTAPNPIAIYGFTNYKTCLAAGSKFLEQVPPGSRSNPAKIACIPRE
jgi:hypothetical protein